MTDDIIEHYVARDLASYRFMSVTATQAVCDQDTFDRLHEYNASLPTGQCDGKVWKRRMKDGWVLGEYVDKGEPDRISIQWRRLHVLPGESDE